MPSSAAEFQNEKRNEKRKAAAQLAAGAAPRARVGDAIKVNGAQTHVCQ